MCFYRSFAFPSARCLLLADMQLSCLSAGRMFAESRSRLHHYQRIVSFPRERSRWNALQTGFHWESAFVLEIPTTPDASRRTYFFPGKSLRFSELFLGILLSEFRFTVFFPGAVEWIHKFPTAIFSQPTFLTSIWTALFEKETVKEKPPRLPYPPILSFFLSWGSWNPNQSLIRPKRLNFFESKLFYWKLTVDIPRTRGLLNSVIKRPRTRSTAARQVSNAHERDLVTNQKVNLA